MSDFFNRKAELIIGKNKWTYPELEMKFESEFDGDPKPNLSKITVYNLSVESINTINIGDICIFNAGYQSDIGNIVSGLIYGVSSVKTSQDIETVIQVKDINLVIQDEKITKTYNPNTNARTILNNLFSILGLRPRLMDLKYDKIYKNGFSVRGKVIEAIKAVVKDCHSDIVFKNEDIIITHGQNGITTGYLLNASTGLLDISKSENEKKKDQYKVKSLLNHNIFPKSIIQIESFNFSGFAIVLSGKHTDWSTEMEVLTIG